MPPLIQHHSYDPSIPTMFGVKEDFQMNVGSEEQEAMDGRRNFKRSLHKQPPPRFTVHLLPPSKHTGDLHGLRITTLESHSSRMSAVSSVPREYDIWRRWEDWLWLQETLEGEYNKLARAKRQRLLAGKGIKKDGVYMNGDAASSWESLPFGPDPNSVAQDLHQLIPVLTKKGTVFRASQATIDQRFIEIKAFLEALFHEDQPTLIQDMRGDRLITDFFGIWRRDVDLQRKEAKRNSASSTATPRASVTSSVFSTYFANASMPSVDSQSPPKSRKFSFSSTSPVAEGKNSDRYSVTSTFTAATSSLPSVKLDIPIIVTTHRHETRSNSSDSSSTSSPRSSMSSSISAPSIAEERPTSFGHNPHLMDRPNASYLSALPEDEELRDKDDLLGVPMDRRPRISSGTGRRARRSAQILNSDNGEYEYTRAIQNLDLDGSHSSNRDSWQSDISGISAIGNMGVMIPQDRSRFSMNSVATFMTDNSVDAIIPRSHLRPQNGSTAQRAVSEGWSDGEGDSLDDYYFADFQRPESVCSVRTINQRSQATNGNHRPPSLQTLSDMDFVLPSDIPKRSGYEDSGEYLDVPMSARTIMPPSPTHSTFSIASSSVSSASSAASYASSLGSVSTLMTSLSFDDAKPLSPTAPVTVKAAFNKTIVIFRATRDIPLKDARQRIRDKFRLQEKVKLSKDFSIALAMQESTRSRNSVVSLANEGELKLISTHEEWRWVMSYIDHSKLTIRILDDNATMAFN